MKQQSGHLHIQVELAGKLHANLPPTVVSLLENPEYKGGGLIALPESKYVKTPTAKEISQNAMWLLPLVNYSPSGLRLGQTRYYRNCLFVVGGMGSLIMETDCCV